MATTKTYLEAQSQDIDIDKLDVEVLCQACGKTLMKIVICDSFSARIYTHTLLLAEM